MNRLRIVVAFFLAFTASLSGAAIFSTFLGTAFGQEILPPPPHMFHKMAHSGIAGDHEYLYVLAGGKIHLYQMSDLTLLKSINLPNPPELPAPPKDDNAPFPPPFPPPHGGGPHGLWVGDSYLFVLAGPVIHEYSVPDLTFIATKELPKPEMPVK